MKAAGTRRGGGAGVGILLAATCAALGAVTGAAAQTEEQLRILRLEATPIGALPPLAMPMPASRNHNYWGVRVQAGHRDGRDGPDLYSIAGGIDLQLRGGSILGVTAGWQERDCDLVAGNCSGHSLFGVRGRFGVLTSGPSLGELFGDYSATATLGADIGFGYAPDIATDLNACTVDLGLPLSLAMLQRVRLVTFITPTVVWDIKCPKGGPPTTSRFLASFGIGLQQIGLRGLDAYLGFQKIFDPETGYHLGISVTYIHVR